MMREYPAYGRTIASHVVRGQKPIAIAVLLSSHWGYYDHVPKVSLEPDEWRLGRFEFGFLRGLHVVAIAGDDVGARQLAELLLELMRCGPALLWAMDLGASKLHEFERAGDVARWALGLAAEAEALEDLPRERIQAAEAVMQQAQLRAGQLWQREHDRILQQRGEEAAARWALAEYETRDRVRELFASPWRKSSDVRAA